MEPENSSRRSRRRRLNRNLSRAYPPQSSSNSGNLYPLSHPQDTNGQSSYGSPAAKGEIARSRPLPSNPRPDASKGFNLRNLLSNDAPNGAQSRREARLPNASSRGNAGAIARSRHAASPARSTSRAQVASVTPIVAQPTRSRPLQVAAAPARRSRRPARRQTPPSPLLYATRLLILGIGIGAIAGTTLSILNPKSRPAAASSQANVASVELQTAGAASAGVPPRRDSAPNNPAQPLTLQTGQPLSTLANTIQGLIAEYQGLRAGVFLLDQDNDSYLDVGGTLPLPAASTIKVPILVAFLQDVDAGKIRLDEELTLVESDVTDGSGEFQYLPVGTKFSALETASKMIAISDNTATNMIIRRLGGAQALSQRFKAWGLTRTTINNQMADLAGTNTTSARDLTSLLSGVTQGELLSLRSRDRLMEIMQSTVTNTLIPAGIGEGQQVVVAHKTGTIDTMVGDTGIVDTPMGKRYVLTVLVQRPQDDDRAQELIRQISAAAYQYFQQNVPANATAGTTALPGATAVPNAGATQGSMSDPAIAPSSPSVPASTGPQGIPTTR